METGKLDRILAEFIRRKDAGERVDIDQLCKAYPDLADAIRSYAEGDGMIRAMAGSSLGHDTDESRAEETKPPADQSAHRDLPKTFGRYEILQKLGEGAMGAVYRARDAALHREVALKVPRWTSEDSIEFRERFLREARAAAGLDHPGICKVFDIGEVNGIPFITMALIKGSPLSRFVATEYFNDPARVARLVCDVAQALSHAHSRGILHRDIKPGNLILQDDGSILVTDFGLARKVAGQGEIRLTQEGAVVGTPAYMAPEQVEGRAAAIGPGCDIYSLGVVFYELLTGQLPFKGSIVAILGQALRERPKPPSALVSHVDPVLEDLCLNMLEKKPENRTASMREVVSQLETWLSVTRTAPAASPSAQPESADPSAVNAADAIRSAEEFLRTYRYDLAVEALKAVRPADRDEPLRRLLDEALRKLDESDRLLSEIHDCLRRQNVRKIEDRLARFLDLQPNHAEMRALQTVLAAYAALPDQQRRYQFTPDGRLQPPEARRIPRRRKSSASMLSMVMIGGVAGILTVAALSRSSWMFGPRTHSLVPSSAEASPDNNAAPGDRSKNDSAENLTSQTTTPENLVDTQDTSESAPPAASSDQPWVSLFDGKTLTGWESLNGWRILTWEIDGNWQIENGELRAKAADGKIAVLATNTSYHDFDLEFELLFDQSVSNGTNCGVGLFSVFRPDHTGEFLEFPIFNTAPGKTWSSGSLHGIAQPLAMPQHNDTWNHVRILHEPPFLKAWINDVMVQAIHVKTGLPGMNWLIDDKPHRLLLKVIAGVPRFRNIRIRIPSENHHDRTPRTPTPDPAQVPQAAYNIAPNSNK